MNEDRASKYHRLARRSEVASGVISAAIVLGCLAGPSSRLRDLALALGGGAPSSPGTVAIYVLVLLTVLGLAAAPMALYRGYLLEHRYGLSTEPLAAWVRDHVKAFLMVAVLASLAAQFVYAAIRSAPEIWWLVSAAGLTAAVAALAWAAPVLLLPLFYRCTPLERPGLAARLVQLAARAGVPVLGVYEWGLGARTRRANAALLGVGRTRRILLSDTLLAEYTDDEIEVILAHELGHHVHRDMVSALALEGAVLFAGFFAAWAAFALPLSRVAVGGPGDVAGLPVLILSLGVVSWLARPALNAVSRRHERRADRFAIALTGRADAFVSAMRRLGAQNLAEERPPALAQWFFHTHPTIDERIEAVHARVARIGRSIA